MTEFARPSDGPMQEWDRSYRFGRRCRRDDGFYAGGLSEKWQCEHVK
jgi:hypothetical protein